MNSKSVYISYSWRSARDSGTFDQLVACCEASEIEVKTDKSEIKYGQSIREYMDKLAEGNAIILVLCDFYFKSPNCMYELLEISRNHRDKIKEHIFPIVLAGTEFHCFDDRKPYIDYWQNKTVELNKQLSSVKRTNVAAESHEELKHYERIAGSIDELLSLISGMNHSTEKSHLDEGFATIINHVTSISTNAPTCDEGLSKNNLGNLYSVPSLPPNYLPRNEYLTPFLDKIVKDGELATGITNANRFVGAQGMGGIGKTVLAIAIAHDEAVRAKFSGGIFWLQFRQDIDDDYLLDHQKYILSNLGVEQSPTNLREGKDLLNQALKEKQCLFIFDDIWDVSYFKHFNLFESKITYLFTTRNASLLKNINAHECPIDLLSDSQALSLLAQYSDCDREQLPKQASAIVQECGNLPLAIAAIGSMVRGKPENRWENALIRLQNAHLEKIPLTHDYSYENLFKAFHVSVEALPEYVRKLFFTLIIFPEDKNISDATLEVFWHYLVGSDEDPLDAIDILVEASLLNRIDDLSLRLHDLLRDYIANQGTDIVELNTKFFSAYKSQYPDGWRTVPYKEPYYFHNNWMHHIKGAGDSELAKIIATDLIEGQPYLNLSKVRKALVYSRLKFKDIAKELLKTNKSPDVIVRCLRKLSEETKGKEKQLLTENDVRKVLKENKKHGGVVSVCLDLLGSKANKEAKQLLKESQNGEILVACIKLLGDEAKEDAKRLLRENQNQNALIACLKLLGDEAKDDAKRLLKENHNKYVLGACLRLLGEEAKEDAKRLLKESDEQEILVPCIFIAGKEEKDYIRCLLRSSENEYVKVECIYVLRDNEALKAAEMLLKSSKLNIIKDRCQKFITSQSNFGVLQSMDMSTLD